VRTATQHCPHRPGRVARSPKRAPALATLVAVAGSLMALFGASNANGDIGELGPPPADPEIRGALTAYFAAGHTGGQTVDVRFDSPIIVGPVTQHPNPPLEPWCVRCGYPDQGISPMYPVKAVVTVTTTQDLHTSSLAGTASNTATYNGTTCPGVTNGQFCSSFFFYRDGSGSWQVV
jgi:hypothetical protein